MTNLTDPTILGRSTRPREGKAAPVEPWLYWARCAGIRDFTEWPKSSRLILCGACQVSEPCREWQEKQKCDRGHRVRKETCGQCQAFTDLEDESGD